MGAERLGELQAHVAEAAQAHHRDVARGPDIPAAQRRPSGDAGAEQRRGGLEVEPVRNLQDECFGDDDCVGIAAVGRHGVAAIVGVVGVGRALVAILLEPAKARLAAPAGIDHAADPHGVACLELRHLGADASDAADDLMARDHGIDRAAPVVAGVVDVGVADAAIENVDHDVVGARIAPLEPPGREPLLRGVGGPARNLHHHIASSRPTRYPRTRGNAAAHPVLLRREISPFPVLRLAGKKRMAL